MSPKEEQKLEDELADFLEGLEKDKKFQELDSRHEEGVYLYNKIKLSTVEGVPLAYLNTTPQNFAQQISQNADELYEYVVSKIGKLNPEARQRIIREYTTLKESKSYAKMWKLARLLNEVAEKLTEAFGYTKKDYKRIMTSIEPTLGTYDKLSKISVGMLKKLRKGESERSKRDKALKNEMIEALNGGNNGKY